MKCIPERNEPLIRQGRWIAKIAFFLLIGFGVPFRAVHADPMETCNTASNNINKSAPMQIDRITVLENTVCHASNGKPELMYRYTLDVDPGSVDQGDISTLKPNQISTWCTTPDTRALFEIVNVKYVYIDRAGGYIGEINMRVGECSD